VGRFGFARLPQTWAEMNGVFNYCQYLFGLAGSDIKATATLSAKQAKIMAAEMREIGFEVCHPDALKALRAYCQGDMLGLRREHTEAFITQLAQTWTADYEAEQGTDG